MINIIFLISILLIFILYLVYRYVRNKKIEDEQEKRKTLELIKIRAEEEKKRIDEEKRKAKEEWEQFIKGKKEPIKLSFYDTRNLDYKMTNLYKKVIQDNLWINEPFHSKFYEFLMLINDNDFMIIDPYSKVFTMNIRDKYNKVQTSRSYQVYSTNDIIRHVITYCISDIKRFKKKDSQNLVISIFVLILKQSVHYLISEVSQTMIDKILKDYELKAEIENIIQMIKDKNVQFQFIQEALNNAFSVVETLPYNDSKVPKQLELRKELPQKFLQHI